MTKHVQFLEMLIGPLANEGSGGGGGDEPTGSVTLTANGTYNVKTKAQAIVAVPPYGEGSVNINSNGTHNVSGKAQAVVAVPGPSGSMNITENGTYDVTDKAQAVVNVSGGGGGEATLRGLLDGSLTGVLSDNVITSLRDYACYKMTGLTGASFPEVTQIGADTFYGCTSLANVSFPKLVVVGTRAFQNCTSLLDSIFPLLKTIGSYSFSDCKALTKVNTSYFPGLSESGASIDNYAFNSCDHLTEVDLPATIDRLSTATFEYCSRMSYVKFLGTRLDGTVFDGCRALTTVLVPNLTTISSSYAFRNCILLESISLPSLTSLGSSNTFDTCIALKRVTFGAHVTRIPASTFYNCSALEAVVFAGATSVTTLANASAFTGSGIASGTGYIYVPDALVNDWKAASNWSTYANQIKPLSELPT